MAQGVRSILTAGRNLVQRMQKSSLVLYVDGEQTASDMRRENNSKAFKINVKSDV